MNTICQGFSHFSVFLHHFVLAKLAASSIALKHSRVKSGQVVRSWGLCQVGLLISN